MSPTPFERVALGRVLSEEIIGAIQEWRLQHQKATLQEIEGTLDERLAEWRVRMLEDVALASPTADVSQASPLERRLCPHCGIPVKPRGPRERQMTTLQGKTLRLRRSYIRCPTCQVGFSPLDEALALLPGQLTPRLQESVVQLGTWLPFARAAEAWACLTGVTISAATV